MVNHTSNCVYNDSVIDSLNHSIDRDSNRLAEWPHHLKILIAVAFISFSLGNTTTYALRVYNMHRVFRRNLLLQFIMVL